MDLFVNDDISSLHEQLCKWAAINGVPVYDCVGRTMIDALTQHPHTFPNWLIFPSEIRQDFVIVYDKNRPNDVWTLHHDFPGQLKPWQDDFMIPAENNKGIPLTTLILLAVAFVCPPSKKVQAARQLIQVVKHCTVHGIVKCAVSSLTQMTEKRDPSVLRVIHDADCLPRLMKLHAPGLIRNLSGSDKDFKMARRIGIARKLRMLR